MALTAGDLIREEVDLASESQGKIHQEEREEEIPALISSDALLPVPLMQVTKLGVSSYFC